MSPFITGFIVGMYCLTVSILWRIDNKLDKLLASREEKEKK